MIMFQVAQGELSIVVFSKIALKFWKNIVSFSDFRVIEHWRLVVSHW